jgi:hypothetical protein
MWNTFVARAELVRLAAVMVETDDRVEEAEALCRCVFDKVFNDEQAFRMYIKPILGATSEQMDRMVLRIRRRGAEKRRQANPTQVDTEG